MSSEVFNPRATGSQDRAQRLSRHLDLLQHLVGVLSMCPKDGQVSTAVLEVLAQEFGCPRGVMWTLHPEGASFLPRHAQGLDQVLWSELRLPAPNPFPSMPMVLFEAQDLEPELLPGQLGSGPSPLRHFLPFEHQAQLLGFALLELPASAEPAPEALPILQRQVALCLHNQRLFQALSRERDTLQARTQELEAANRALRKADQLKSEFLALTSHELRTPLTGILGFTRLVLDGAYDDEQDMRSMLQDSYDSGQHLLGLLNDILDLAKIEAGRLEMRLEPCDLPGLLAELRPLAEAYPRGGEVALRWPKPQDLPEMLVDPARLKQVLLNLLSNALKFTPAGQVEVRVDRLPDHLEIQVVDTGIGLEPEVRARLFQKFTQGRGGHDRAHGGSGLGLVICKHLMALMGGDLLLHSEGPGQGTTATLTVPTL